MGGSIRGLEAAVFLLEMVRTVYGDLDQRRQTTTDRGLGTPLPDYISRFYVEQSCTPIAKTHGHESSRR